MLLLEGDRKHAQGREMVNHEQDFAAVAWRAASAISRRLKKVSDEKKRLDGHLVNITQRIVCDAERNKGLSQKQRRGSWFVLKGVTCGR
jgi:hypothetical protein